MSIVVYLYSSVDSAICGLSNDSSVNLLYCGMEIDHSLVILASVSAFGWSQNIRCKAIDSFARGFTRKLELAVNFFDGKRCNLHNEGVWR